MRLLGGCDAHEQLRLHHGQAGPGGMSTQLHPQGMPDAFECVDERPVKSAVASPTHQRSLA